jgi:hypothetical protein
MVLILPNIAMAAMDGGTAFDANVPGLSINIWQVDDVLTPHKA